MISDAKPIALHVIGFILLIAGFLPLAHADPTRYRYRLEGIDRAWQESPSKEQQATYTTLPAGRYVLQVQMAIDRSTWQTPGISLRIQVLPPWWDSWWFRTLCALILLAVGSLFVRARVRHVTRAVTLQMEARNNERMRIAGDLHDTLLQGLLSASFQLAVVQDQLAPDDKAHPLLDHVSSLLRQLVAEGRNAIRGLRTRNFDPDDFERAIATIGNDVQIESRAQFTMTTEGKTRLLRPAARTEAYLIAREAICNALRHADASHIEVHLQYLPDRFWLTVRDDGRGFVAEAIAAKQTDHFGLSVMIERAQRLDGVLTVSSRSGAGTEIVLSAPGRALYQPEARRDLSRAAYE